MAKVCTIACKGDGKEGEIEIVILNGRITLHASEATGYLPNVILPLNHQTVAELRDACNQILDR